MKIRLLLIQFSLIFLIIFLSATTFVSAGSVTASVFYDSTSARTLTINNGQSFGVIVSADSIFESGMNVKLDLLTSSGNLVKNILDVDTVEDSYSNYLTIGQWAYSDVGNYILRAIVTGESGQTNSDEISFSVVAQPPISNQPPYIVSNPVTQVDEGQTYTYQVVAGDPNGDTLTFSLTQAPSWLSINSVTGRISGIAPLVNTDTDYQVRARVSDGTDFVEQSFTVTVKNIPVNNPPVITSSPVTNVNEGQNYIYQITANDADGDTLTFSLTQAPSWLSINPVTGLVSGTAPQVSQDTTYSVTISVADSRGGLATQSYVITVIDTQNPDTTPPTITIISPVNGQIYSSSNVLFEITTNENTNAAWYSLNGGNNVAINAVSSTRYLATVSLIDGTHTVRFYARDLAGNVGQSATITFYVENIPVNNPPVITSSPVTNVNEGQNYIYQITANDADGDTLTFSLTQAPSWLSINSVTGRISGIAPLVNTDTDYQVRARVSDGTDFVEQSFTVTVRNVAGSNGGVNRGRTINVGARHISDGEDIEKYISQFQSKTVAEEEISKIEKKETFFESSWAFASLIIILLILTTIIVIFLIRR